MVKKFFCSIGRWIKRHKVITVLIVIILIAAVIATFIISIPLLMAYVNNSLNFIWLNHKFCGITDFEHSSSC